MRTFVSTAHGSGRIMSRRQAKRQCRGEALQQELAGRGIVVRTASWPEPAEAAGGADKDINDVVDSTEHAGISRRVVRLTPIGDIKG